MSPLTTTQIEYERGEIENELEEGRPPRHVVIHRDGKFYLDVESLINRLDKARDLTRRFDLVEIRRSGNPRIAEYDESRSRSDIADRGVAFHVHNGEHSYLTTTGGKEGSPGTPRPRRIVKRHGSTDFDTLAEQPTGYRKRTSGR